MISTILLPLLSVRPYHNFAHQKKKSFPPEPGTNQSFAVERNYMVAQQLQIRGISDQLVIQAMKKVPREKFVPPSLQDYSYRDCPLPIGYNQTISQPYIVAYMTEAANISSEDKVLEIGTGCGYQTAVLAEIAQEVYSLEIIPELAESARKTLKDLGYTNIHVKVGDGYQGWEEYAPYNAIIVTAAPNHIPPPLLKQLAVRGKMVIPVGEYSQDIFVITNTPEGLIKERTIPVRFVPLR
jgi:protein-L-isoaspartate(D-aspartate) O-methyltransferase